MCPFDTMSEPANRSLTDKFMLRLPDGMRERIKASADANNRSMNAEIISRLEESFDGMSQKAELSLSIDLDSINVPDLKEKLQLITSHLSMMNVVPKK